MRRAVLVVVALGVITSCATDAQDSRGVPSPPGSPSASSPAPSGNPCIGEGGPTEAPDSEPDTAPYLGLTEQDASDLAKDNGLTLRVAGRDGECFALTMDYRVDRVNVYLDDAVVTAASIG